ncbi:MAG: redoxin domain-containing protein [Chloroflexi bacterium]|nr:redoxin domain-containing protein [Chloroflexota bacterium]
MRRTIPIGIGMLLGVMIGGLLFLLIKSGVLPHLTQAETLPQVMATVNGVAITRETVEKEITVSRFNVASPLLPLTGDDLDRATDEALNQLITRQLVLQAASRQNFVLDDAVIESRVELLFGANGDQALDDALRQVGATHADLTWWVRELTTIETFTVKVIMAGAAPEERQQVYNDWLNAQRAAANIKTYLHGEEQSLLALIGEPAPNFTLTDLAGQPVALSDYSGKVVLVNFWATWCPSCLSELPDYEQVYQQHGGSAGDFVILGVNLQESQSQVEDYSTGLGVTFPVLLDTDGNVTTRQYQVTGMPGSFIIDRQGIIFYRHVGPLSAETLQAKLAELGL